MAQSCAIPSYRRSCSSNTADLTGFAEALRWANSFIPPGARLRILFDSKHAARVTPGVAHAKSYIALPRRCSELLVRLKCNIHAFCPSFFYKSLAGNAGNECADVAASLGMRGFISDQQRSSSFGLREIFLFFAFSFEVPHRLTQIAEVLHSIIVQFQLG